MQLRPLTKHLVFFVAIFVVLVSLIIALKYPLATLTGYDTYFHIAHAISYTERTSFSYPLISYFTEHPSNPWFGYHHLLAATFTVTDATTQPDRVAVYIFVHAVLAALVLIMLSVVARQYFSIVKPTYDANRQQFAVSARPIIPTFLQHHLLLIGAAVLLSGQFAFRTIALERPQVVMILLTLLATWAVLKQRTWYLFIVSAAASLLYSLPLFVLLPWFGLMLGVILLRAGRRHMYEVGQQGFVIIAGLVVGILLHPQSYGYVLNGIVFHVYSILQSVLYYTPFSEIQNAPSEMVHDSLLPSILWPVFIVCLVGALLVRVKSEQTNDLVENVTERGRVVETGFTALSLLLVLGSFFISRLIEYAYPFAIITTFSFGCLVAVPWCIQTYKTRLLQEQETGGLLTTFHTAVSATGFRFAVYAYVVLLTVTIVWVSVSEYHTKQAEDATDQQTYQEIAVYLQENSINGVVHLSTFQMYPQFILANPQGTFTTGFDSRLMQFYDYKATYDNYLITHETEACTAVDCNLSFRNQAPTFFDTYQVEYVVFKSSAEDEVLSPEQLYPYLEAVPVPNLNSQLLFRYSP